MEKINLSDLLEPEHMDPVKRIALIRIVDDDGGVRESYKFLIESEGWRVKTSRAPRPSSRRTTRRCRAAASSTSA